MEKYARRQKRIVGGAEGRTLKTALEDGEELKPGNDRMRYLPLRFRVFMGDFK